MDSAQSIRQSAGALKSVTGSLKGFGVDSDLITKATTAVTLIASGAQTYTGVRKGIEVFTAVKQAEFFAQLAKWGPYAAIVAPVALAAGYAAGNLIQDFMDRVG